MFFVSAAGFAAAMTAGAILFNGSLIMVLPHALIAGALATICAHFVLKLIDADDRERPGVATETRSLSAP
jgi:hypothetical protein